MSVSMSKPNGSDHGASLLGLDDRRADHGRRDSDDPPAEPKLPWQKIAFATIALLLTLGTWVYTGDRSETRATLSSHDSQLRALTTSEAVRAERDKERDRANAEFQQSMQERQDQILALLQRRR